MTEKVLLAATGVQQLLKTRHFFIGSCIGLTTMLIYVIPYWNISELTRKYHIHLN